MFDTFSRGKPTLNVIFTTTKWGTSSDDMGEERQKGLLEGCEPSSRMARFTNTPGSAHTVIKMCLENDFVDASSTHGELVEREKLPKEKRDHTSGRMFSRLLELLRVMSSSEFSSLNRFVFSHAHWR
jgi:hypothetical protein